MSTPRSTAGKRGPRFRKEQQFVGKVIGAALVVAAANKIANTGVRSKKKIAQLKKQQQTKFRINWTPAEAIPKPALSIEFNEIRPILIQEHNPTFSSSGITAFQRKTIGFLKDEAEVVKVYVMSSKLYEKFCKDKCYIKQNDILDVETNLCQLFASVSKTKKLYTRAHYTISVCNLEGEQQIKYADLIFLNNDQTDENYYFPKPTRDFKIN